MSSNPRATLCFCPNGEALSSLQSAGWLVLVCRGGAAVALELARLGKPLLVVEENPEQLEELQRQLGEEEKNAITVYCELLGSEVGETCWHRYNDSRLNGTTELEILQADFPNLRLQSLEQRRIRRLDAVLEDWKEHGQSTANGHLARAGALVAFGVAALPLLQGCGRGLERFSKLLIPPPILETDGDLETWPALLRRHCLQPSSDIPLAKQQEGWILLQQDRQQLLEEQLQQALSRISTVEAERDYLATNQQALTAHRDGLANELDSLKAERDGLSSKQNKLTAQCDGLVKELDALNAERDDLATNQQALIAQRDGLANELDALKAERDGLATKQQALTAQRDGLANELDALKAERDDLAINQQALAAQHDSLANELGTIKTERDALAQERDNLLLELGKTAKIAASLRIDQKASEQLVDRLISEASSANRLIALSFRDQQ